MRLDELHQSDFDKALTIATKAHEGQKRWGGDPYITHPKRVAAALTDPKARIVAILHDVIEDSEVSDQDLLDAGFDNEIVDAVLAVTRVKGESYKDFIHRAMGNEIGKKVKRADIEDNLTDLPEDHSLRERYAWALEQL